MAEIPTVPLSEDTEEDRFETLRLSQLADHHELLCSALQDVADGATPNLMVFMPPGSAKALALDTPIPTPSGWKLMGELRIGDELFDECGVPCRVTWVSPIHRDRPVYSVKTDCGDEIIADRDHEWLVRLCGKRPVEKIKETHQLHRRRAKRPMITRAGALDLPEVDLPIDPYLLGIWLGDGNSAGLRITSAIEDQRWLRPELGRLGYETRDSSVATLFGVPGVRRHFVELGLINDPVHSTYGRKHIPPIFMRASAEQRLSLLQGLVDTDGTVCKSRGSVTFCNTNRELAEQVRELVRSLGVKAGWSEGRATLNGRDCGPVFRVSFYHERAARLPRKAVLCRAQYRTPNTYIDVDPAGTADTVCIEVNSPNHLFLCGRSMTPTHNSTYVDVVFVPWFMARKPKQNVILTSYGSDLARKQGRRARQLVRSKSFGNLFDARLSAESSAADEWSLTNGSEYMAGGILSGVTGNRADLLVVDDPVQGREQAESETIRRKTRAAFDDDLATRLKPGGRIVIIQTRWHEDDLAGSLLPEDWNGESGTFQGQDGRTWRVICIPAQATDDDILGRSPGEFLWKEWFSAAHWVPFMANQRTWSALFQQKPQPDEGTFFKREYLKEWQHLPNLRYYGTSDYAVTEGAGDATVHRIWGVDRDGNVYRVDGWSGRTASDVWIDRKVDLMARYKPLMWYGEAGVIQKAVEPMLKRVMAERNVHCAIEWLPSVADKPTRARSFQALAASGKVYFEPGADLSEFLAFPAGKHDDDVDAASLIGRAIDQVLPARDGRPAKKKHYAAGGWMG